MAGRDAEEPIDTGYGEASQYAAHLDRGWALLDRGDLAAARTSVSHAQEIRPDDPDAIVLQGAIALAEGQAEESLRCYERALELDPDYLEPYAAAAQVCLFDLDDPRRALRYCEEGLEIEGLTALEGLDMQLMAAEAELALGEREAGMRRLTGSEEIAVLDAAIELAAGREDLASISIAPDSPRAAAAAYLHLDHDGEALEDEERIERVARILQFAARLSRLRIDLGDAAEGLRMLRRLVELFPEDADAWYLCSEAEHRHGDLRRATDAAMRTLDLDAATELPPWVPTAAILHRRVVQLIKTAADAELRGLVEGDVAFTVLIKEQPAAELVAEGVDPRLLALALVSKPPDPPKADASATEGSEAESSEADPGIVTGIAVYPRNLARYVTDGEQFAHELRVAVIDELAACLGLDDTRREALGLATGPVGPVTPAAAPEDTTEADDAKAARHRRRRGSRALN